jgi:DNA-binding GntR family transcriptional regulator
VAKYKSFVNLLHLFRARSLVQGGGLAVSNREHAEIVAALAAGDVERAQDACRRHVELAKHRLIRALQVNQFQT